MTLHGLPLLEMPESVPVPGETILLMENLEGKFIHGGHIKEWTKSDPTLSQLLRFIFEGRPTQNNSEELNRYFTK